MLWVLHVSWTKAKRIKAGERVRTFLGPLPVKVARRTGSGYVALTVDAPSGLEVSFYFLPEELLERVGPTLATMRKPKVTHSYHPTAEGYTGCLKRISKVQLAERERVTCPVCWYKR